ncbi:MAG: HEAT repeat domain-containing protein, partial [Candidatus Wukongarchaeota archaeon]|nr:HEAT repeat domain-containing protein [Candidatus Wukongarchaeota archaeon]
MPAYRQLVAISYEGVDMGILDLFKPNVEKMKAKKDVKGLIKALKYKRDQDVRRYAALTLGEIGDAKAVEPLIQALKEENKGIRWNAVGALDKLGWKPEDDIEKALYLIAKEEWDKLVRLGEPAVEPLIQALKDKDINVRRGAAETLGKIGDARAVEPLTQSLKDGDKDVRRNSTRALGKIGEPAVEPLMMALKDKDVDVRKRAAETLGEIGDARAVEPLTQALKDEDGDVRWNAVGALDKLGWKPEDDIEKALYLIAKEEWDKLVRLGEPAVEPLIQALKDKDINVRRGAA